MWRLGTPPVPYTIRTCIVVGYGRGLPPPWMPFNWRARAGDHKGSPLQARREVGQGAGYSLGGVEEDHVASIRDDYQA